MRWLLSVVCVASLCSTTAFAQFTIVSFSPVDGAVGVPLLNVLSLTFSEPLDTAVRFSDSVICLGVTVHEPEDSVQLLGFAFSEDLTVMMLSLQHTPETDFTFMVDNAFSQNGHYLDQPFSVCYTTAAEHGAYTMSGTVSYSGDNSPQYAAVLLSSGQENGGQDKEGRGGVIVLSADGHYTVNYVRNGVYWPLVFKDLDHNGDIDQTDAFGIYDLNADGVQDSVVVNGANVDGIDLTLAAFSAAETPAALLPASVRLAQNYPNPFNPETEIAFSLPRATVVSLTVYDLLGRAVAQLANGPLAAGEHALRWNAANQPGGIYFYRLDAGAQSQTRKMLLVK